MTTLRGNRRLPNLLWWRILVAMSQLARPVVEESPRKRELRERRALMRVRARRVEAAGLPACLICGGSTAATDDVSLYCDCAAQVAMLARRVNAIVHSRLAEIDDLGARIAP